MKYILTLFLFFFFSLSYSQDSDKNKSDEQYCFNFGYKNPKECLVHLKDSEKKLLFECLKIIGTDLESLVGVDEIYNTSEFFNCNIKAVVKSDYMFLDVKSQTYTNTVVETLEKKINLREPKYMVFVKRDSNGTKITLQMYY